MSTGRQDDRAIQDQMIKYELIEGLQRAIENSYRRLRETARHEWESRFTGKDPSERVRQHSRQHSRNAIASYALRRFSYRAQRVNSKDEKISAAAVRSVS